MDGEKGETCTGHCLWRFRNEIIWSPESCINSGLVKDSLTFFSLHGSYMPSERIHVYMKTTTSFPVYFGEVQPAVFCYVYTPSLPPVFEDSYLLQLHVNITLSPIMGDGLNVLLLLQCLVD